MLNFTRMTQLDIVLPFYNGSKFIGEQLKSIQENDVGDIQIKFIIVNDASSEADTKFLKSILPENHVYIENPKNLGLKNSIEIGLKATTSEYVMLSDQDDVWLPNKINNSLKKLQSIEQDGPALVYTDLVIVGPGLEQKYPSMHQYYGDNHRELNPSILLHNVVTGCTVIMNRKLLNITLPFPPVITVHDHWIALCAVYAGNISVLNEATILYRQHGNNLTGAPDKRLLVKLKNSKTLYRKVILAFTQKISMVKSLSERMDSIGLEAKANYLRNVYLALEKNQLIYLINQKVITGTPLRMFLTSLILTLRNRIK